MGQEPEPQRHPLGIGNCQPQRNPHIGCDSIKGNGQISRSNRPQCNYRRITQHHCNIGLTQRNDKCITQYYNKCFTQCYNKRITQCFDKRFTQCNTVNQQLICKERGSC